MIQAIALLYRHGTFTQRFFNSPAHQSIDRETVRKSRYIGWQIDDKSFGVEDVFCVLAE